MIRRRVSEIASSFSKEMRCLIRDQHTVVHSLLIPLFLYPALVWAVVQVLQYSSAVQEKELSRVRLLGAAVPEALKSQLEDDEKISVLPDPEGGSPPAFDDDPTATAAYEDLLTGEVDAWLVAVQPDSTAERLEAQPTGGLTHAPPQISENAHYAYNSEFLLFYRSADDASEKARRRLTEAADSFRKMRLEEEVARVGADEGFLQPLSVEEQDVATAQEVGNWIASLILPLLMLVMTALGALYPALDVTVGERERNSLETTLVSPVGREAIVLGKYFSVVVFSLISFVLNFASMGITLLHLSSAMDIGGFALSIPALIVIGAAAVLLSSFFGAVMMLLAFHARTFKEGQSYLMTVYLLAVIPAFVVVIPELTVSPAVAWIPLVNIASLFRQTLSGALDTYVVSVTLLSSLAYVVILLTVAVTYLKRLEVVAGAGSWRRWWSLFSSATRRSGS